MDARAVVIGRALRLGRTLGLGRAPLLAGVGFVGIATISGLATAGAAGLDLASGGIALDERSYGAAVQCTLNAPVADTYVRSDQSGTSFGSASTLQVNNSSSATQRILVRFDLAGCSPAIPPDAIIHAATLRLTTAATLSVGPRTYDLGRVSGTWSESTTWSSQPAVDTVTSSATVALLSPAGTPVEWDVAVDVQAFIAGEASDHGWRISDSVEGVTPLLSSSLSFHSREAATLQPGLTITYAP